MRLRQGWSVRLLVSLAAQSITATDRQRRLQGSGGSPRTAHGRPSGTVAWRNVRSSFPPTYSTDVCVDIGIEPAPTAIILYGPQAALLHKPSSAQPLSTFSLQVASVSPRQTTR